MSKKVDICDLCQKRWPEYKFQYRASRYTWEIKTIYDICGECWDKLAKQVRKANKE